MPNDPQQSVEDVIVGGLQFARGAERTLSLLKQDRHMIEALTSLHELDASLQPEITAGLDLLERFAELCERIITYMDAKFDVARKAAVDALDREEEGSDD